MSARLRSTMQDLERLATWLRRFKQSTRAVTLTAEQFDELLKARDVPGIDRTGNGGLRWHEFELRRLPGDVATQARGR